MFERLMTPGRGLTRSILIAAIAAIPALCLGRVVHTEKAAVQVETLVRLEVDGARITHEERLLTGQLGRIRDVQSGPDGLLYLLTDASNGALVRLSPAPE